MGNSLLVSSALMGMDVRIVAPAEYQPSSEVTYAAHALATKSGAQVIITDDVGRRCARR